jgi:hypothetical protein
MCNLYEYELQEWEIAHLIEHYRLLGLALGDARCGGCNARPRIKS